MLMEKLVDSLLVDDGILEIEFLLTEDSNFEITVIEAQEPLIQDVSQQRENFGFQNARHRLLQNYSPKLLLLTILLPLILIRLVFINLIMFYSD